MGRKKEHSHLPAWPILPPQEHWFNQQNHKCRASNPISLCRFLAETHGHFFSCSELKNTCLKTEEALVLSSFTLFPIVVTEQEA